MALTERQVQAQLHSHALEEDAKASLFGLSQSRKRVASHIYSKAADEHRSALSKVQTY